MVLEKNVRFTFTLNLFNKFVVSIIYEIKYRTIY